MVTEYNVQILTMLSCKVYNIKKNIYYSCIGEGTDKMTLKVNKQCKNFELNIIYRIK